MPIYREKPDLVEAIQLTEELAISVLIDKQPGPFGLTINGSVNPTERKVYDAYVYVNTFDGPIMLKIGDWIIKELSSKFLTGCCNDEFVEKYEPNQ